MLVGIACDDSLELARSTLSFRFTPKARAVFIVSVRMDCRIEQYVLEQLIVDGRLNISWLDFESIATAIEVLKGFQQKVANFTRMFDKFFVPVLLLLGRFRTVSERLVSTCVAKRASEMQAVPEPESHRSCIGQGSNLVHELYTLPVQIRGPRKLFADAINNIAKPNESERREYFAELNGLPIGIPDIRRDSVCKIDICGVWRKHYVIGSIGDIASISESMRFGYAMFRHSTCVMRNPCASYESAAREDRIGVR